MTTILEALQQIDGTASRPPGLRSAEVVDVAPTESSAAAFFEENWIAPDAVFEGLAACVASTDDDRDPEAVFADGVASYACAPGQPDTIDADALHDQDLNRRSGRRETPEANLPPVRWPLLPSDAHTCAFGELAQSLAARFSAEQAVTLMFTSPGDGQGTLEVLLPVAAVLAEQTGQEVLLLDADFRRAALAGRLGTVAATGLADILMGTTAWQSTVRRTAVPHLSLLPGGRFPVLGGGPPQRLNLQPLLEELGRQYAWVLVNAPSLAHRETAPVAADCSGTLLVVRLGHTVRRAVGESVLAIEQCGGRLLGSVAVEA